jgi:hypothetical protein
MLELNRHVLGLDSWYIHGETELLLILGNLVTRRRMAHRIGLEWGKGWYAKKS